MNEEQGNAVLQILGCVLETLVHKNDIVSLKTLYIEHY